MKLSLSSTSVALAAATVIAVSATGRYIWKEEHRPPVLEVYIFNLAHGQAAFIRTPDDKRIVIDGGSNVEVVRHLSRYLPFYSRRIDALIVTEPVAKNVTGLIDITERYSVERAYVPVYTLESLGLASTTDPIFAELLSSFRTHKIPLGRIAAGDEIQALRDVSLKVLFPADPALFAYSKASAPETVLTLSYRSTAISFFGNASRKIQKYIASSTPYSTDTDTHVLVMSHTGAAENLSSELIEKIKPDYFIFSQTLSYSLSKKSSGKKTGTDKSKDIGKRINLREYDTVQVISDGSKIEVLPERH